VLNGTSSVTVPPRRFTSAVNCQHATTTSCIRPVMPTTYYLIQLHLTDAEPPRLALGRNDALESKRSREALGVKRHLLYQSNHKTQVIWKGRVSLLCYSLTFSLLCASRDCWHCLLLLRRGRGYEPNRR
jgi:hypothetical protein